MEQRSVRYQVLIYLPGQPAYSNQQLASHAPFALLSSIGALKFPTSPIQ